jgi:hypothetical protein
MQSMLAVAIAIILLRGFSYLRAFDTTRYLVGMISEIVKDMYSFFIILLYAMFGLAII